MLGKNKQYSEFVEKLAKKEIDPFLAAEAWLGRSFK